MIDEKLDRSDEKKHARHFVILMAVLFFGVFLWVVSELIPLLLTKSGN